MIEAFSIAAVIAALLALRPNELQHRRAVRVRARPSEVRSIGGYRPIR